jgi:hypothetical protein
VKNTRCRLHNIEDIKTKKQVRNRPKAEKEKRHKATQECCLRRHERNLDEIQNLKNISRAPLRLAIKIERVANALSLSRSFEEQEDDEKEKKK